MNKGMKKKVARCWAMHNKADKIRDNLRKNFDREPTEKEVQDAYNLTKKAVIR